MPQDDIDPHLLIVLGGHGDLMARKLLPAIYHLHELGFIEGQQRVLAVARHTDRDDESVRKWARESIQTHLDVDPTESKAWCSRCLYYHGLGGREQKHYEGLKERIEEIERENDLPQNRVFYLAIPPTAFETTVHILGELGLNHSEGWTRIVVEKPFGRDLESARALNDVLTSDFEEQQIYRIDHYLGKETVQNLMVFRFANPIFEALWNRDHVRSVHITVAESVGIGDRGEYYDEAGALRDMVQNHLTQLLTLTGMGVPAVAEADMIRDEKVKVLHSLQPITPADVVMGQYTGGEQDGEEVVAYREEADVDPQSDTETYVAMRLALDNWHWAGVPFYLRTGKRMNRRITQIVLNFERAPTAFFCPFGACHLNYNRLVLTLQPDENFDISFEVKAPGSPFQLQTEHLHFNYEDAFGVPPDAYQTLLLDILRGDQTLFVRGDETERAWEFYAPILKDPPQVHEYEPGSWGPAEADELLRPSGDQWLNP
ncbi:MAG: glucose-6-phosphate dehydrogenase [Armatimonadota bacterium]